MGTAVASRRKRAVTPINDFAQMNRHDRSFTQMNTLRFQYQMKRSNMFSLALRGIKLFGYLFLTLSLLLLVLNFQLIHDGTGNFTVAAKDTLAFTDTFVSKPQTPSVVSRERNMMRENIHVPTASSGFKSLLVNPAASKATDTVKTQINQVEPIPVPENTLQIKNANESALRCSAFRNKLAEAVLKYNLSHKDAPMRDLEIFSLLSEGLIDEIPDCPTGGQYTLDFNKSTGNIRMTCSSHN